jgi:hypothetical protein
VRGWRHKSNETRANFTTTCVRYKNVCLDMYRLCHLSSKAKLTSCTPEATCSTARGLAWSQSSAAARRQCHSLPVSRPRSRSLVVPLTSFAPAAAEAALVVAVVQTQQVMWEQDVQASAAVPTVQPMGHRATMGGTGPRPIVRIRLMGRGLMRAGPTVQPTDRRATTNDTSHYHALRRHRIAASWLHHRVCAVANDACTGGCGCDVARVRGLVYLICLAHRTNHWHAVDGDCHWPARAGGVGYIGLRRMMLGGPCQQRATRKQQLPPCCVVS